MNRRSNGPKKAFISKAGWFSLHYPFDWEAEEDEYVAIYAPQNGVGALHISAYQAPGLVDPKSELSEHLAQENPSAPLENIQTSVAGTKTVASFESVDQQSFYKVWFVAHDSYLLIATYNCDTEDRKKEMAEIEEIVQSIDFFLGSSRN